MTVITSISRSTPRSFFMNSNAKSTFDSALSCATTATTTDLNHEISTDSEDVFQDLSADPVIVRDIGFRSMCEHHLLPVEGKAQIAYLHRDGRTLDEPDVIRIVQTLARMTQEASKMAEEIAKTIDIRLRTQGLMVIIESDHVCRKTPGVLHPCSNSVVLATRGLYQHDLSSRSHAMNLIRQVR